MQISVVLVDASVFVSLMALIMDWLSPDFEFMEEPIIYWLYRGGLNEETGNQGHPLQHSLLAFQQLTA
jgi:hypothetical protein